MLDESGQEVEKWTAAHTAEGLRQAIERLAKRQAGGQVLVAIETPHGLFVEALSEAKITLYVVNPKVSKRLREALVGESKNDEREAWALGEALRLHHPRWKPLAREDVLTRKLQVLTRDEQGFIEQANHKPTPFSVLAGWFHASSRAAIPGSTAIARRPTFTTFHVDTLKHNLFLWAKASVVWVPWCRAFYFHEKKRGLWTPNAFGVGGEMDAHFLEACHVPRGAGRSANPTMKSNGWRVLKSADRGCMKRP